MPSWQDHLKNSFRSKPPPPPPESVEVLVLPANGDLHITTLPLIETPIRPATIPTNLDQKDKFLRASASSMIYHYKESTCEPNIRFLPDTLHSGHWDQESWEFRCIVGTPKRHRDREVFTLQAPPAGMHLFYTLSKKGIQNSTVGNIVCGDVFILKVSDSTDVDGLTFYVDVESNDVVPKMVDDLLTALEWERHYQIDALGRYSH